VGGPLATARGADSVNQGVEKIDMPIYEYSCQKCGRHLEVMQKMSDKPLTRCPECKGKLEKIFSQTSFQLKGSGWYVSDYTGRGKAEKAEKSEKSDKSDKSDKSEKKEAAAGTCAATGGGCATGMCDN
jgi:putative FmdB family regulatory protein